MRSALLQADSKGKDEDKDKKVKKEPAASTAKRGEYFGQLLLALPQNFVLSSNFFSTSEKKGSSFNFLLLVQLFVL